MRQRCHFGAGWERVDGLGFGGTEGLEADTRFERKAGFRQDASLMSTGPVYLDCNATTPMEPAVGEVVRRFFEEEFGNEGSRTHTIRPYRPNFFNTPAWSMAAGAGAEA